jgi:CheY-like chemotaxis protein
MTRQLTPQRILVVDDEAPMRKFLSSNLKVLSAVDGVEALKLFEEHRFDLLLLDINLAGPNGLQVLQAVRRDALTPVLMLSGRGRERDADVWGSGAVGAGGGHHGSRREHQGGAGDALCCAQRTGAPAPLFAPHPRRPTPALSSYCAKVVKAPPGLLDCRQEPHGRRPSGLS